MLKPDSAHDENRILVFAPTGKDGENSRRVLGRAGLRATICRNVSEVCSEIGRGAGAVVLTEEAISLDRSGSIAAELSKQPAWSDLPLLLMTHEGPESRLALHAMRTLGNVLLLERPIRVSSLVTAVRAALRAREKQYEVRRYIAELHEADNRKDEFLAMLAHELRNPLAPVRNALQIMRVPTATPRIIAQAREITERQVAHMSRLIDDLLEVSRVSRGKIALKKQRVDLRETLENVRDIAASMIGNSRQILEFSFPETPLHVSADPARLEQIFVNLLTNAVKYTPSGGRISVSARKEQTVCVVTVADNGIGIDSGILPRIFDLFVQAEQGSDRSQGGLGIGLTLVKTLVEMHGGKVSAASGGRGKGSEFTVRLPADDADAASPERDRTVTLSLPTPSRLQKRILVVDDNADAAESLGTMLRLYGHDVVTAGDGVSAIESAAHFMPDFVFLDIGLPGMSGFEVAKRIRDQSDGRPMTLVALTGYGQDEIRRQSSAVGFDHHFVKPADPDMIQALLCRV